MNDFICIGPTPADEKCANVGDENYGQKARKECQRFIDLIRKKIGDEPVGARLCIKGFEHEFGRYYEVVCKYDPDIQEAVDYALRCESGAPKTWEEE